MGDVGQQRPQRADHGGAEGLGRDCEVVHERPPAQLGLVAYGAHQIMGAARYSGNVYAGGGPHDLAGVVVVDAHVRPGHGEVEEVLGVDGGDVLGLEVVAYIARCGGTRFTGVVPSLECGYEDG